MSGGVESSHGGLNHLISNIKRFIVDGINAVDDNCDENSEIGSAVSELASPFANLGLALDLVRC